MAKSRLLAHIDKVQSESKRFRLRSKTAEGQLKRLETELTILRALRDEVAGMQCQQRTGYYTKPGGPITYRDCDQCAPCRARKSKEG